MARHDEPGPWQQDYERAKEAGFPSPGAPAAQAATAAEPAAAATGKVGARPAVPPRRIIISLVIAALVIVAAIIGHSIASSSSIVTGDCVVTNPNPLTGWDIKKVACGSSPGSAVTVQQVVSVQHGSSGQCSLGLTTFQDDPAGKTYCLAFTSGDG